MSTTRRAHLQALTGAISLALAGTSAFGAGRDGMDEHTFWKIVEAAKLIAGADPDLRPQALEVKLGLLDLESIEAFQRTYESLLLRGNRWDLWGAAYLMNGGSSDDGFKYFRDWLISEGQRTYEMALSDPDALASFPVRDYFELELFGYAALRAFAKKGGGELDRDVKVEITPPVGRQWRQADLPAMFPRLAAKFLIKRPVKDSR